MSDLIAAPATASDRLDAAPGAPVRRTHPDLVAATLSGDEPPVPRLVPV
jgi:hypothetical protein